MSSLPDDAAKIAALERRIDELEQALISIGALITDNLGVEGTAPRTVVRQKAEKLAQTFAEAGHLETARLLRAFRDSAKKPWSFFAWLNRKFT